MRLAETDPTAKALAALAFPNYNGRKFVLDVVKEGAVINMIWEAENGGSYDYYALVNLTTMKATPITCNRQYATANVTLTEGVALVTHSYFMGKDSGITITITEANATKMIAAPIVELTVTERKVLVATRSLKSTYNGIKNYRQVESGLSPAVWSETQELLKGKGLLMKSGGITPEGRNAVEGVWSVSDVR